MTTKEYQPVKCETCQFLRIIGGDWVPYDSTKAQLPWECEAQWTDEEDKRAIESGEGLVEQLFLGKLRECPHFLELLRCSKYSERREEGRTK